MKETNVNVNDGGCCGCMILMMVPFCLIAIYKLTVWAIHWNP